MDKKGFLGIPLGETLELLTFLLALGVIFTIFYRGCSMVKKTDINEEQKNKLDMLASYINELRVEDGEKIFPIKIDDKFKIEAYGKCKANEQPGVDCSTQPKICLKDITNEKISPYCRYVENTDLVSDTEIKATDGFKLKKVEKDNRIITEIT